MRRFKLTLSLILLSIAATLALTGHSYSQQTQQPQRSPQTRDEEPGFAAPPAPQTLEGFLTQTINGNGTGGRLERPTETKLSFLRAEAARALRGVMLF